MGLWAIIFTYWQQSQNYGLVTASMVRPREDELSYDDIYTMAIESEVCSSEYLNGQASRRCACQR